MRKKNLEFIGLPLHEIYEDGTVRSLPYTVKTLKGVVRKYGDKLVSAYVGNQGYYHITVNHKGKSKGFNTHRALAMAFIDNPKNYPVVNHIDGNKLNNSLDNLEWCTHSKNIKHAWSTGLNRIRSGVESTSSKLNPEKVKEILQLVETGDLSNKEIGKLYGVSGSCISDVIKGKTWSNKKFGISELQVFSTSNNIITVEELINKLKEIYER